MKYNIRKYILAGITAILAAVVLTACGGSKPEKDDTVQSTQEIFAMDTYMSLTAYGSNSEEAVSKAVQEINRLDAMFSVGNEDSDVTKINENGSSFPFLFFQSSDNWFIISTILFLSFTSSTATSAKPPAFARCANWLM